MPSAVKNPSRKRQRIFLYYNRAALKIGLPWILQVGSKVHGASHVIIRRAKVETREPVKGIKPDQHSIVVHGRLRLRGDIAIIS